VFTNPWTAEEKTVILNTPDGTDGEWVFEIEGVSNLFEDLDQGRIEFEDPGTWRVSVSESGNLIKNINLQVIEQVDMGIIKLKQGNITSAQILTAFDSPVELVAAPGAGKILVTHSFNLQGTFLSSGGVAYDTNVDIRLLRGLEQVTNFNNSLDFTENSNFQSTNQNSELGVIALNENLSLDFAIRDGNPLNGNGTLKFSLLYEEIDFNGSGFN